jgi:hypothetical protein
MNLKLQAVYNSQLRYFYSSNAALVFTIWLAKLFDGSNEVQIFVELNEAGLKHLDAINKIEFTEEEKTFLDETTKVRKTYIHYATSILHPTADEIVNFTDFICNSISQTPLKSIFEKLEKCINQQDKRN